MGILKCSILNLWEEIQGLNVLGENGMVYEIRSHSKEIYCFMCCCKENRKLESAILKLQREFCI